MRRKEGQRRGGAGSIDAIVLPVRILDHGNEVQIHNWIDAIVLQVLILDLEDGRQFQNHETPWKAVGKGQGNRRLNPLGIILRNDFSTNCIQTDGLLHGNTDKKSKKRVLICTARSRRH